MLGVAVVLVASCAGPHRAPSAPREAVRESVEAPAIDPPVASAPEEPAEVSAPPTIIHHGVDLAARAALRALPLPRARAAPARTCIVEDYAVIPNDDDTGVELSLESDAQHTYDAQRREVLLSWNSNPVGLSGEVRHRYDELGDPVETQEIPFESIEGGRPPRPAPSLHRVSRSDGGVEVVIEREGRVETTVRYHYDEAHRVASIEVASDDGEGMSADTTQCRYDAVGRPLGHRIGTPEQRVIERTLVYEGDRLIGVSQGYEGDERAEASVWSSEGSVWVYWGEFEVTRYRGECAPELLGPCVRAEVPSLVRGEPSVPLPAVRFGRPLDPAAAPIEDRIRLVRRLGGHDYLILGEASEQRGEMRVDEEAYAERYVEITEREGELPEAITVLGPEGSCAARAVAAVRLETMTRPYHDEDGWAHASFPAFDAIEIESPCPGVLAVEYDAAGVALHASTDEYAGEEEQDDGSVRFALGDDWSATLRRGPSVDDFCPGDPVFTITRGRRRMGRIAEEVTPLAVLTWSRDRAALLVTDGMTRSLRALPSGDRIATWRDPARTTVDFEANPCL